MTTDTSRTALCVDLDGTLLRTDLLWECLLRLAKQAPWALLLLPIWLLRGKAVLKQELARRATPDVDSLPLDERVLDFVRSRRAQYARVLLVTASTRSLAEQVAARVGLFDEVLASEGQTNLRSEAKARALCERFGERGFDYVANSRVDLPVWRHARAAVTVNASASLARRAAAVAPAHEDLGRMRASLRTWLRAIRVHQWAKNALLFVPLLTAHRIGSAEDVSAVLLAFLAFGLVASATYILNDLLDLDADRHHATKRTRALASGAIPVQHGILAGLLLLGCGIGVATRLPPAFGAALGVYLVTTVLYSLRLKRVASLDVILLAGLYTLRVIAGALAIGVAISFWLLAFSMFVFLCLAMVKRVSELLELAARNKTAIRGREYSVADLPVLQILGASSGYIAVLVLALYINSPEVKALYATPLVLWLIAPLMLLWVTRLWVVTARGYMNEDPIVWAIKDPETWVTAAVTSVILLLAAQRWA